LANVDPQRNPFGLVIDCYEGAPQRIASPVDPAATPAPAPENTP